MYTTSKKNSIITGTTTSISQVVIKKLSDLGKTFPAELLEKYGAVQGMIDNIPVLAFPMDDNSWHGVSYISYPKEPRFLNASERKNSKFKLSFLGLNVFPINSDYVFLVEGIWDMLTMAMHGYPVLGLPGVNNLQSEWIEILRDKKVYILFDNDDPGVKFAELHSRKISFIASEVKILTIPSRMRYKNVDYSFKDISDLFLLGEASAKKFIEKLLLETEPIVVSIKDRINEIMIERGNNVVKSMIITDIIIKSIEQVGGALLPFNNSQEMAIVIDGTHMLVDEKIDIFLAQAYGYIPSDSMWRFIRDRLYVHALNNKEVSVDLYSVFKDDVFYIGTKNKGLIVVEGDVIKTKPQGYKGVYVKSGSLLTHEEIKILKSSEEPSDDIKIRNMDDVFNLFTYNEESNAEAQKFLLKTWFYYTYFNSGVRPALCVVGSPGCGKTLLLKILKGILFGFRNRMYNPNSIPEEDYVLTSMLKEFKYLFLDEVNENDAKIKTKLRMMVTGEESVYRPKYAKQYIKFKPNIWLILSSHSPKFRDSDISQRLSIISLDTPDQHHLIEESTFFEEMDKCRPYILRSIFKELSEITQRMKNINEKIVLTNYCRQIEMANFGYRAFPHQRSLCTLTFNTMDNIQNKFSAEFDPLIDLVDEWYRTSAMTYMNGAPTFNVSAKQMHEDIWPMVKEKNIRAFPASVAGFGKWITSRMKILNEMYGCKRYRNTIDGRWDYEFKVPEKETF